MRVIVVAVALLMLSGCYPYPWYGGPGYYDDGYGRGRGGWHDGRGDRDWDRGDRHRRYR